MKRFRRITTICLVLYSILLMVPGFVACSDASVTARQTPATLPEPVPDNFAFRFRYGSCLVETVDTFNSTFTHDMGPTEKPVTINLELTPAQKEAIYRQMMAIDLFSYPENFAIIPPDNSTYTEVTPSTSYTITVQSSDMTRSIYWDDKIVSPTTPQADHLRELFQMIIAIVNEHPEIQQLPAPSAGCV